jgi:hypothetical protein
VPFHTSRRTLQVYYGGKVVFATGRYGIRVPSRRAGSFTIHNHRSVHGVTSMSNGARFVFLSTPFELGRYELLFCGASAREWGPGQEH